MRNRWTAALLLLLMWTVSAGLTGIAQGLEGASSTLIVVLALALGWLLVQSGQAGVPAAGLAGWIGLSLISLHVGRLGDEYLRLADGLARLAVDLLTPATEASTASVLQALETLLDGYRVILVRTVTWVADLVSGGAAIDPIASAFGWSVLLWVSAVWAAWWTWRRARPLLASLPALALLGTTLYLSRSSHAYLLPPLSFSLLLLAFVAHADRERRWTVQRVSHPEGLLGPLAGSALPVSLALVVLASFAPDLSIEGVRELSRRARGRPVAVNGGLPDRLGLNRASRPGTGFEPMLIAGLPNRHLIGAGPELSERVVMNVTLTNPPVGTEATQFRWRALTYNRYNGRGWQTTTLAVQAFGAGHALIDELPRRHQLIQQQVQAVGELGGLAYSAGELITVDQDYELAWRELGRDLFAATLAEDSYAIESLLPQVTVAELRQSGTDYPDYVLENYLDLPSELPSSVSALARELTATAATPFDRAQALERYLRDIPYTLEIPAPPSDRDVVEYFLFDLRRGYCDYYASAMAVLARAAGLPARLVVGYASGTPQSTEGTLRFTVTEAEAHSWVELYFPRIGWVEFEPTAGRPAIERPAERFAATEPEVQQPRLAQQIRSRRLALFRQAALWVVAGVGSTALLGLLGWSLWDSRRLRRLAAERAIAVLYSRLFAALRRLREPLHPGLTPHELLAAYRQRAAADDVPAKLLHPATQSATALIESHLAAAYAPDLPGAQDRASAQRAWRRLRIRLWLARLIVVFRRS